jgi:hypothetical protein
MEKCDWRGELEMLKRKRNRKEISGYSYDRSYEEVVLKMALHEGGDSCGNRERRSLRRNRGLTSINTLNMEDGNDDYGDEVTEQEDSFIDYRDSGEYTVDTHSSSVSITHSSCEDDSGEGDEYEEPESIEDSVLNEEPVRHTKKKKKGELVIQEIYF